MKTYFEIALKQNSSKENVTDEVLLEYYVSHSNLSCLAELYKRYLPLVYGFTLKYLHYPEVAQEAVLRIFEELKIATVESGITNFKEWLYLYVRAYCQEHSPEQTISSKNQSFTAFCNEFDPAELQEKDEKTLQRCISVLPEKQRICVQRFFLEGQSFLEIKEATGFSLTQVKELIQEGKLNINSCLNSKQTNQHETD